jgi:hypothetical protein
MEGPGRLRADLSILGVIAAVLTLAHLLTLERYGVFRDELYYVACGERLAWGYVDHPPLVAVLARAGRALFGSSLAALRLLPVLFGAALVFVVGAIVRRLGGGRFAQALAALGVAVAPHFLFAFHVLSMNGSEVLLWALGAYLVVLALTSQRRWPWLLFGVVAGVGLLNKHSMLLFGLGVFVGLLLTPARRQLLTPWPWLAGLIAAALFLPHVLWQVRNDLPTAEFVRNAQEHKIAVLSPATFLSAQALMMNPVNLPIWLAGLWFFAVRPEARRFRLFAWAFGVVLAVLLVQRAKPYYLTPIYPVLLAGGAVLLESWTAARPRLRVAAIALLAVGGVLFAPFALPVLPVERFIAYSRALGQEPADSAQERHALAELPQHFADMFGWQALAQEVSRVYQQLPAAEQGTARVFAQNYGEAGALEYFGDRYPLPAVVSPHNNYWYWGPGPDDGGALIVVGGRREDLDAFFSSVQEAGRTRCDYCMPFERDLPLYVCRGWKQSIGAVWPRLKRFI